MVIPTIGRPSLEVAVASACAQTRPPLEIIVVFDGTASEQALLSSLPDSCPVRILTTGGGAGAAGARNLGMRSAHGALIAFLDDDDSWLPFHLEVTAAHLDLHPDVDVVATRALLRGDGRDRLMPRELLREDRLLHFLFGSDTWRARERRIPTSSLVFRTTLAQVPMDPAMPVLEDTWWLLTVEDGDRTIRQLDAVTVVHNYERGRTNQRLSAAGWDVWLERLRSLSEEAYVNYLVGTVMRTAARRGDVAEVRRLAELVKASPRRSGRSRVLGAAFLALAGTTAGLAGLRRARR